MDVINNIDKTLGEDLKRTIGKKARLSIAASIFSIYAYEALKKELEQIEELRFIFTSPTFVTDKLHKEKREFYIPKLNREKSLYGTEFEIRLKNELTLKAIAKECGQWIKQKATFKSNNTSATLQGFINVENGTEKVTYMPVNAFTTVDLGYEKGNALSNMVNKFTDYPVSKHYFDLFEQVWQDEEKLTDVTDKVIDHISTVYKENSPEFIYFLILYNIFNEFLEDISQDLLPNEAIGFKETEIWKRLYNFQKDAVIGGINKLEKYNGCILADSVGLGKTFSALGIIKYYELRNKSVLVLCPKKLGENWLTFRQNVTNNILYRDRFRYDVLYHTDLSRESGYSNGIPLDRINWGNYDLLVIDESHNFRNNEARKEKETRYQKLMRKVIQAGVKTKVLMLSATPVNNRFNDLKNQLALAYEGDPKNINPALNTEKGVEEIFRRAQAAFNRWSRLPVAERTTETLLEMLDFDFFELLDSVTIARSRKHIQKYYDTKEIGSFPKRLKPLSYYCDLTRRQDVIGYNEIFKELSRLTLALYAPFNYILPSRIKFYEEQYDTVVRSGGSLKQLDRERSLQVLMRINLLKRLESSVDAFRITLSKMLEKIKATLELIDTYNNSATSQTFGHTEFDAVNLDDDDWLDENYNIGDNIRINLSDMDRLRWREDLERDRKVFVSLLAEMEKITPEHDEKLATLKKVIAHKISKPINPGNKKILIFTAFADTAAYLFKHVAPYVKNTFGLETAKVVGSDENKTTIKIKNDLHTILTCFSPKAKEKHLTMPDLKEELDILIATDCISEGQNLQDCDYLINYDIHWNPVRIVQRFGRIDRIGSSNEVIQLVNFWPNMTLDEYINLKERVENRMVIMDMTATGEDNVLSNRSSDLEYRKEQLKKLQEEAVDFDEVNTGVSITDLGLNDFRMDLLEYVKQEGDLSKVWWDKDTNTEKGTLLLKELFNNKVYDYPKPIEMIFRICEMGSNKESLILDFFSGSATTAHAVMQLNAEDGGNRKYIMVQLPEPCPEDSEAYKAGFKNISEIGKERIRRAAKMIKEETGADIDYGFRVFKVDSSNMKDVYYRPGDLSQRDLFGMVSNIKEDRTGEDLLIQVMLEWGLELSLPMEKRDILGKEVHFVAGNSLVVCFDEGVSEGLVREIAKEKPLRVVFRDSSFADDAARINVEELFKMLSPTTEIKVI